MYRRIDCVGNQSSELKQNRLPIRGEEDGPGSGLARGGHGRFGGAVGDPRRGRWGRGSKPCGIGALGWEVGGPFSSLFVLILFFL